MAKKIAALILIVSAMALFVGAKTSVQQRQASGDEVLPLSKDEPAATETQTETAQPSPTGAPATATATATPSPAKAAEKKPALKKSRGAESESDALIARIKTAQQKRKAIKMKIKITTTYEEAGASQEIKGEVTIKKKDKFMVRYTEPSEQLLISNGVKLWVYTPSLNQVIVQDMEKANLDTHFYIEIESSIDFFAKNSRTTLSSENGLHVLKMKPFNKEAVEFDEITVKVEKEKLIPVFMSMKYEGQKVDVAFSEISTFTAEQAVGESGLKDSVFEFKVPEGAEEIEASDLMQGMQ